MLIKLVPGDAGRFCRKLPLVTGQQGSGTDVQLPKAVWGTSLQWKPVADRRFRVIDNGDSRDKLLSHRTRRAGGRQFTDKKAQTAEKNKMQRKLPGMRLLPWRKNNGNVAKLVCRFHAGTPFRVTTKREGKPGDLDESRSRDSIKWPSKERPKIWPTHYRSHRLQTRHAGMATDKVQL